MPKEDLVTLRSLLLDYHAMLTHNVKGDADTVYIQNIELLIEDIENRVQYTPSP